METGAPFDPKSTAEQDESWHAGGSPIECRYRMRRTHRSSGFQTMSLSTKTSDEPLEIHAGLFADSPARNSRFSGPSASSNASAEPHARTFGLSLAAVLAACLVLNAVSSSPRVCQPSDRDFVTTRTNSISASSRIVPAPEGGSHAGPLGTIHSKECATNEGREEPGY